MVVVVGGHSRYVGKTGVGTSLIRTLPGANWNAVRLMPNAYGQASGTCELSEEPMANSHTEGGRYLAAGARRSFSLRACNGCLAPGMPELKRIADSSANLLVESTTALQWMTPDLCLFVVDLAAPDWRDTVRAALPKVDAFVMVNHSGVSLTLPADWPADRPLFHVTARDYTCPDLASFVAQRLHAGTVQ